jgi:hypothetical protein
MNNRSQPIYVETHIRSSVEKLWEYTQTPEIHQRWDLRFTDIHYLPHSDGDQSQQFLYSTRIGFGLKIQGKGETVGNARGSLQQRTSALKFWSDDPKSLIREGSGYWKYTPVAGVVRFITAYDYTVRYGILGKVFDKLIFRPLLGWATAWSFDRLRLWLEQGLDPGVAFRQSLVHATARVTLAFIFIYQGVIPKLIYRHPDEITMLTNSGVTPGTALSLLTLIGWSEVVFGLLFILLWRAHWLFVLAILLMVAAILNVAVYSASYLFAAFNPVTLNVLVVSLAIVGILSSINLPSARRCLRQKPELQDEVNL